MAIRHLLIFTIIVLVRGDRANADKNDAVASLFSPDYKSLLPDQLMPAIVNKNETITAVQGDNITIPCDVIRLEKHSVIWTKEDSILWVLQGNPVRIQYVVKDRRVGRYNTSLVIHDITLEDEGLYACELSSRQDEKIYLQLIVNVPPTAVAKKGIDFVQDLQGSHIELHCTVDGKPMPNVTWERENGEKMNGFAKDASYILHEILPEDAGVYICVASNGMGDDSRAKITVNVHFPPYVEALETVIHAGVHYDASLSCIVKASPFPKVIWLKEDAPVNPMRLQKGIDKGDKFSLIFTNVIRTDFGVYSCNASNFWGNGSATIELTGRPLAPTITSSSDGNLPDQYTLTWEVKSYSSVIYYDVFFRNVTDIEEDNWFNVTIPGSSGSSMYHSNRYILRDLMSSFPMEAKVRAINEFGTSEWSQYFQFETFDPGQNMIAEDENIQLEVSMKSLEAPKTQLSDAEGVVTVYDPEFPIDEVAEEQIIWNSSNPFSVLISQNISASALSSASNWLLLSSRTGILTSIILFLR